METSYLKPIPQGKDVANIRGKKVDLIQTVLDGQRIDFGLDKVTHLPYSIDYYFYDPIGKNQLKLSYILRDYRIFDGIAMATKMGRSNESGIDELRYQFNVKYDESIFMTPPPFDAGPEAWKLKK